jgi:leader peptidase (prepilin peptidase)/N-methyltransferase
MTPDEMMPHLLSGDWALFITGAALLSWIVGYALLRAIAAMSLMLRQEMARHGSAELPGIHGNPDARRWVPALCAISSALVAGRFGFGWTSLWALVLLWALLILIFIDLETLLLPDRVTLPLLWVGLLVNSFDALTDLHSAVWGAMAGYALLWLVYWLYWGLTRREGLGYGDLKLLAALGAWLGWQALPAVLLLASVSGVAMGLFWVWRGGHSRHTPIPFGPFLAAAGYGVMLWGKGGLP